MLMLLYFQCNVIINRSLNMALEKAANNSMLLMVNIGFATLLDLLHLF